MIWLMQSQRRNKEAINREIIFPDGSEAIADLNELFDYADLLAYHYGIGACKSFTQYVSMVNEEDPVVIRHLIESANRRQEQMYGKKGVAPRITPPDVGFKNSKDTVKFAPEQGVLIDFLKFMGVDKKDLGEALTKIKQGKIKTSGTDYSWITSDKLSSPGFDVMAVLAQMKEDEKNSINFKVSEATRQAALEKQKQNG